MRPKRLDDIPLRELPDGESMLLTVEGDRALVLNAVATAVWHLADGERDAAQIGQFLADHFDETPAAQIDADVACLLAELLAAGVIEDLEAPPGGTDASGNRGGNG